MLSGAFKTMEPSSAFSGEAPCEMFRLCLALLLESYYLSILPSDRWRGERLLPAGMA